MVSFKSYSHSTGQRKFQWPIEIWANKVEVDESTIDETLGPFVFVDIGVFFAGLFSFSGRYFLVSSQIGTILYMVLQTPSPLPRLRKDEAGQYKRLQKVVLPVSSPPFIWKNGWENWGDAVLNSSKTLKEVHWSLGNHPGTLDQWQIQMDPIWIQVRLLTASSRW